MKKKKSDEFTIPEYQALMLWAFMEAAVAGKLKIEIEFEDVKTLLLDRKELPTIHSVRIPKISPEFTETAERLNTVIEESD